MKACFRFFGILITNVFLIQNNPNMQKIGSLGTLGLAKYCLGQYSNKFSHLKHPRKVARIQPKVRAQMSMSRKKLMTCQGMSKEVLVYFQKHNLLKKFYLESRNCPIKLFY